MGCFCVQFFEPGAFCPGLSRSSRRASSMLCSTPLGAAARSWGAPGRGRASASGKLLRQALASGFPARGGGASSSVRLSRMWCPRGLPGTQTLCLALCLLLLPEKPSHARHRPKAWRGSQGRTLALDPAPKRYMLTEDPYASAVASCPSAAVRVPRPPSMAAFVWSWGPNLFTPLESAGTSLPLLWPPLLALGLSRCSWSLRSSLFTFCKATTPRGSVKRQGHKMGTEQGGRGRAKEGQAARQKVQVGEAPPLAWGGGGAGRFPCGDCGGGT